MKILVTGGTGFIGSHLIDSLLSKSGVDVYALVRRPGRSRALSEKPGVKILPGDLFSIPSLPCPIDVVFHLAGLTKAAKAKDYYTVNQKGTASLFRQLLAQRLHPKIIHLSSLAAAGPSCRGKAVSEDDPPRPVSAYGDSKLKAEREALSYKNEFPLVILRVAAVFGPGDQDFLAYFKFIKKGIQPLFGSAQRSLSLCYVHDLIRAMNLCANENIFDGEIFNIADEKPYTWDDIGKAAARILDKKLIAARIPLWTAWLAAAASEGVSRLTGKPSPLNRSKYNDLAQYGWVADVRKAKARLGFETRYSLEQAMRETIEWYIRNSLL